MKRDKHWNFSNWLANTKINDQKKASTYLLWCCISPIVHFFTRQCLHCSKECLHLKTTTQLRQEPPMQSKYNSIKKYKRDFIVSQLNDLIIVWIIRTFPQIIEQLVNYQTTKQKKLSQTSHFFVQNFFLETLNNNIWKLK